MQLISVASRSLSHLGKGFLFALNRHFNFLGYSENTYRKPFPGAEFITLFFFLNFVVRVTRGTKVPTEDQSQEMEC